MVNLMDYNEPIPAVPIIRQAVVLDDKLRLARYASCHCADGETFKNGTRIMYLRVFDRYGAKPLPEDWRTRMDWSDWERR